MSKVSKVLKPTQYLLSGEIYSENFLIYLDSQTVINVLTNIVLTFVLVHDSRGFFRKIS